MASRKSCRPASPLLAAPLILCVLAVACDDGGLEPREPTYIAQLHSEDEPGNPAQEFAPGDSITYVYDVVNRTDELREFEVNGRYYRTELRSDDGPWEEYSQACVAAFQTVSFEPHQRRLFSQR